MSYRWGEAINRLELGDVVRQQGEYGLALELTRHALKIFQEIGDSVEASRTAAYLGRLFCYLGDYPRAQAWFDQFLHSTAEIESHEMVVDGLVPLAVFMLHTGDTERACAYAEPARRMAREVASPIKQAHVHVVLAQAYSAGNGAEAEARYHEALAHYDTLATAELAAEPRAGLAGVALARGDMPTALATPLLASASINLRLATVGRRRLLGQQ